MGEHRRTGRISIRHFYARRALRLLPPLFITVALLGIYAAFVFVPDAGPRIWGDVLAAVFYYADFRSASGHEPFLGSLAQAWSLSIEEQFYVVWSLLLLVAIGRGQTAAGLRRRHLGSGGQHRLCVLDDRDRPPVQPGPGQPGLFQFWHQDRRSLLRVPPRPDRHRWAPQPALPWLRWTTAVAGPGFDRRAGGTAAEVSYNTRPALLWWLPVSIVASAPDHRLLRGLPAWARFTIRRDWPRSFWSAI